MITLSQNLFLSWDLASFTKETYNDTMQNPAQTFSPRLNCSYPFYNNCPAHTLGFPEIYSHLPLYLDTVINHLQMVYQESPLEIFWQKHLLHSEVFRQMHASLSVSLCHAVETFSDLAFSDIFLHLLTGNLTLLADEFALEEFCTSLFDGFFLTACSR